MQLELEDVALARGALRGISLTLRGGELTAPFQAPSSNEPKQLFACRSYRTERRGPCADHSIVRSKHIGVAQLQALGRE